VRQDVHEDQRRVKIRPEHTTRGQVVDGHFVGPQGGILGAGQDIGIATVSGIAAGVHRKLCGQRIEKNKSRIGLLS